MERKLDDSDKYSIVYFEDGLDIPKTLFHITARFHLPQDADAFCRRVVGNNHHHMGRSLQSFLMEENMSSFSSLQVDSKNCFLLSEFP